MKNGTILLLTTLNLAMGISFIYGCINTNPRPFEIGIITYLMVISNYLLIITHHISGIKK